MESIGLNVEEFKTYREFDINTHISLKNKYVFFQISKSASSSVKYILQQVEVKGTGRKVINVNDRYLSPHICPSQLDAEGLNNVLFNNEYKKITFVRNPYSRVLSCYLHRILSDKKSASNRVISRYTKGRDPFSIDFSEFVSIICNQTSKEQESHWRVQSDDVFFDKLNFDFVGKVESLDEDLKKMCGLLNCDFLQGKDKSPKKTSAKEKIREYYNDKLAYLIYERYKKDFENFGYFEDPFC